MWILRIIVIAFFIIFAYVWMTEDKSREAIMHHIKMRFKYETPKALAETVIIIGIIVAILTFVF
jgi:hypothetical protein